MIPTYGHRATMHAFSLKVLMPKAQPARSGTDMPSTYLDWQKNFGFQLTRNVKLA
jgi:hypothetical protein